MTPVARFKNATMTMFSNLNTTEFFDRLRKALREPLTPTQMRAVALLLTEADNHGVTDINQMAYILATCWHECRFKSMREIRSKKIGSQLWKWQNRYWPSGYYGRGFSQLTWLKNYRKFSPVVGVDLVSNPDAALIPEIGAQILVFGMVNGTFVSNGLKSATRLSKFFPAGRAPDWMGARAIVNGTFQADKVASGAVKILSVIVAIQPPTV